MFWQIENINKDTEINTNDYVLVKVNGTPTIKKIKKEIVKRDTSSNESKVITLISKRIELTHRYKTSELNAIIRAICEEYGLRKIPASKLKEYFVVEEKQLKIDGKTTKCMTLIQRKAI